MRALILAVTLAASVAAPVATASAAPVKKGAVVHVNVAKHPHPYSK